MYLVDGNNMIGRRAKGYENWYHDKAGARRKFLSDLANLAKAKKFRLAVVFDGAPDQRFPDGASYRGVKIFYARPGSDADTRIVEMAEAERDKKSLTVVTSDRKLTARVRVCGVKVMRTGEFQQLLDEAAAHAFDEGGEGEADVKAEETGDWLRYFGVDENDE